MISGFVRATLATIALLALVGCNANGELAPSAEPSAFSPAPAAPSAAPAALGSAAPLASQAGAPNRGDYKILPEDVLEVNVYQVTDFNRPVQVDSAGMISLPLLGAVPAAGKTTREVEGEITRRLKAKFLQNPQVTVVVKDGIGMRVTVEGAVKKPGVITARGNLTLLRVMAESGGFDAMADQSAVMIFRNTPKGRTVARFDVNDIRAGKSADPPVYGGDTVIVDESGAKTAWKAVKDVLPLAAIFMLL